MDVQSLFSLVLKLSLLGSVMAGVIFLIKKGFHNKMSAHWHYYIWLLLIARLIIPYSFETPLLMPEKEPELSTSSSVGFEGTIDHSNTTEVQESNNLQEAVLPVKSSEEEKIVSIKSLKQVLPIVWIAGATITLLIMLLVNFHFHWRLSKKNKCDDYELLNLLEECKQKLKVKAKVQIIYDESMGTPSVVSFFRPKILINKNMLNSLSSNEIKFVLLHELTHVNRNDILIHWIIIFVQAIHWFNPIIWYSFYAMRKDCEISCDASVLSRLKNDEHLEYGSSLLTVIEQVSKKTLIPRSIGMSTSRSHMKLRLERITMFKKQSWKWITLSSILAVGIIVSGFTTFTNTTSNDLTDIENDYLSSMYYEQTEVRPKMWDEIFDETKDILKKNGYEGRVEDFSAPEKYVKVAVLASGQEIYDIKGDVINGIQDILNSYGYEGFEITLFQTENLDGPHEVDIKVQNKNKEIDKALEEVWNQHKIWRYGASVDDNHMYNTITLGISDNDKRTDFEVEDMFRDILLRNGFSDPLKVQVHRFDVKKYVVNDIYLKVGSTIIEGLINESEALKINYTPWFDPDLNQINVKTSMVNADKEAELLGSEIERIITEFLQSGIVDQFVFEANEFLISMGEEKLSNDDASEIFEIVVLDENNIRIN
ncbi:M56 family metallopeptidase [Cytobacillus sp. IB215665]|uniref:M56 family metallopeptidase n=1 Tax=Cytobacillus sp. IB215665 TaxID=3097357 RepID=UPI002A1868C1|nr:M56 family metallopeptidase [Cytobacillus sp. IB215665]MDX8367940.1 M56 family metallopeptidase [Cytobacillus sp. IB215665]